MSILQLDSLPGPPASSLDVSGYLLTKFNRTKVCDLAFVNDTKLIEEIPTKAYSDLIYPNITDVSTVLDRSLAFWFISSTGNYT